MENQPHPEKRPEETTETQQADEMIGIRTVLIRGRSRYEKHLRYHRRSIQNHVVDHLRILGQREISDFSLDGNLNINF